jgi:predicted transcriptional regulator
VSTETLIVSPNAKVLKRSRFKIYYDILRFLCEEKSKDKQSITRVAHEANLPYDRFRNHLDKLIQLGMISHASRDFVLTKKGLEYFEEFKRISDFLSRAGLLP